MIQVVTPGILDALMDNARAKRRGGSQEALRASVNSAAWQVFSRLLDILRLVADSSTIRPNHVYNTMRLAALIRMPLHDASASRHLMKADVPRIMHGGGGGSGPVLPHAYFDPGVIDPNFSAANLGSFTSLSPTADAIRPGIPSTFGGGEPVLTDAAMNAMLAGYRARGASSSGLRIGEGSRKLVKRIVEANLVAMLSQQGPKRSFDAVLAGWNIVL